MARHSRKKRRPGYQQGGEVRLYSPGGKLLPNRERLYTGEGKLLSEAATSRLRLYDAEGYLLPEEQAFRYGGPVKSTRDYAKPRKGC